MSEEFEKWYEHSKDVTHVNTSRYFIAEKAWQAARELDAKRIAELESQNKAMREALELADEFISNGIEFGYVRMPDDDLKGIDKAHDTPEIIRQALALKKEG